MPTYYFEDFPVGERRRLGSRTITEDEIVRFARDFDPQPFHVDPVAARESIYGGLIASGWHTCALVMRILCEAYLSDSASLGSPGVEQIRWLRAVRPDDTLVVYSTVFETRPSQSKPDRGIVFSEIEVRNERDEVVLTMRSMGLFVRRGSSLGNDPVSAPKRGYRDAPEAMTASVAMRSRHGFEECVSTGTGGSRRSCPAHFQKQNTLLEAKGPGKADNGKNFAQRQSCVLVHWCRQRRRIPN